jgi:hypothetical protein
MTGNGFPTSVASLPTGGPSAGSRVPTAAQRRFAAEHRASVGPEATCPPGARFVYGENGIGAVRWLVDRDGAVLDRLRLD